MADGKVELSEIISKLRADLYEAGEKDKEHPLRLLVEEAEVELQVAVTKEAGLKGGVKFWVYSTEADGKISSASTQRIKLKLRPTVIKNGEKATAEIAGQE